MSEQQPQTRSPAKEGAGTARLVKQLLFLFFVVTPFVTWAAMAVYQFHEEILGGALTVLTAIFEMLFEILVVVACAWAIPVGWFLITLRCRRVESLDILFVLGGLSVGGTFGWLLVN